MFAQVTPLRPLPEDLFYIVPPALSKRITQGSRIIVPLGRSQEVAFVRELMAERPKALGEHIKAKDIIAVLDEESVISPSMFKFVDWLKEYYFYPSGEIIRRSLPTAFSQKKTAALAKRMEKMKTEPPLETISIEEKKIDRLNHHQEKALQALSEAIDSEKGSHFLLHGVTGSGKTIVYIEAIQKVLSKKKEALILVPEIALTPQLIARFQYYFKDKLAIFHSSLTPKQRLNEWLKIKFGKATVAIGVRSAIFLPFSRLGIIIVDEEHENTFKQDDRLKYNARDLAILRGKLEQAIVILGSATPSFESFYKAQDGAYQLLSLPEKACQVYAPSITLVNLRGRKVFYKDTLFSLPLFEAMKRNLEDGKQTLLFLNRTGFSNFVLCTECGTSITCPNCSISLIYYRSSESMQCPYCDYKVLKHATCPSCKSQALEMVGSGTERVEEDLKKYLPAARIARMDRLTTETRGSREEIIKGLSKQTIDVLVGTQMIAKGLDFHNITLVGVIMADSILNMPDFKSAERTFQLVAQVSGRSGRGIHPGKVFIQTYNPEHYAIRYVENENFIGFYNEELPFRRELGYPPFKRLISVRLSGNLEPRVKEESKKIADMLRSLIQRKVEWRDHIHVLGPAPKILYKVRNKYRYHVLIKSDSPSLSNALLKTLERNYENLFRLSGIRVSFDVDPMTLM